MSENRERKRLLPIEELETRLSHGNAFVQAEAQARLRKSGYSELHHISCELHEGVATLRGRVSTFYLKQVAQTLVRQLAGIEEISNRLEVAASPLPR